MHMHVRLQPAVETTKARRGEEATEANIDACVVANVHATLNKMRTVSPILAGLEADNQIALVPAVYNISTGQVRFLLARAGRTSKEALGVLEKIASTIDDPKRAHDRRAGRVSKEAQEILKAAA